MLTCALELPCARRPITIDGARETVSVHTPCYGAHDTAERPFGELSTAACSRVDYRRDGSAKKGRSESRTRLCTTWNGLPSPTPATEACAVHWLVRLQAVVSPGACCGRSHCAGTGETVAEHSSGTRSDSSGPLPRPGLRGSTAAARRGPTSRFDAAQCSSRG